MKKIVVKVDIHCQLCKKQVLKAVAKLEGINQVAVEGEKGMLTVVGDVDPVEIVKKIRKIGKFADIVTVGPPKPPEPPKPVIPVYYCYPPSCYDCQLVPVGHGDGGGGPQCYIM